MRIWRSARFPLLMATAFMPVTLIMAAYQLPDFLSFIWVLPVLYVLLDAVGTKIRKKWRILYCLAELAIMGFVAFWSLDKAKELYFCAVPAMYAALMLVGIAQKPQTRNEQIHWMCYVIGVISHLVGQLLLRAARVAENDALEPIVPGLLISFFIFAFIMVVSLNQTNLSFVARAGSGVSKAVQRKNLLLTLAFFGITLGISFVPALVTAASKAALWLLDGAKWFLEMLAELRQYASSGNSGDGGEMNEIAGDISSGDGFSPFLRVILATAGIIVGGCAMGFLCYLVVKKVIQLVKQLAQYLRKYIHAVSEDYVDVVTDLREEENGIGQKVKREKRLLPTEVRKLPPDQQIRYRYRQLMRRHPEWDSGSTARENLNESAASVYEWVRYKEAPVTEADAQRFVDETKKT